MTEFSDVSEQERRNFRVSVQMNSFLYPVDGNWEGRRRIETINVSCGGIAFYASPGLEIGETAEVVLPMTVPPLIIQVRLLRKQDINQDRSWYGAKFVELRPEADQMIGEAVFDIQRQNRLRDLNKPEEEV